MIYDLSAHPRDERAAYGFLEIFDRVLELLLVSRDGVDQLCAPFLGTWYLLGILVPTVAGALLGPRMLRW